MSESDTKFWILTVADLYEKHGLRNSEVCDAREVERLERELAAANEKLVEARNSALEEAALIAEDRAEFWAVHQQLEEAGEAASIRTLIRSLKSTSEDV